MPWYEKEVEKLYFKIGKVAEDAKVATSAIRFWEGESSWPYMLRPKRNKKGQRIYSRFQYLRILHLAELLRTGNYTVQGAIKLWKSTINNMIIRLERTRDNAMKPTYGSKGAACFDLAIVEGVIIKPGETIAIPTGFKMEVPEGWEVQIRPRSGISLKTALRITNSPGTIDSDYRGEVGIIVQNTGDDPIYLQEGQRIAQGKLARAEQVQFTWVQNVMDTERGEGGFGSTGTK